MADILVVDDDPVNRRILRNTLKRDGYNFFEATNGQEALEKVASKPPDLILLDVVMPEMDGMTCCKKLQQPTTRNIPVILVTSLDDHEKIVDGLNIGATDYITKPFTADIVRARVRAALRSKKAHDQVRALATEIIAKNKKLTTLAETAHRFVDDVSHEFRTPLTVIMEYASIISEGLVGPVCDEQVEYLHVVTDAVQDLSKMVDDLLDTSKLRTGSLRVDRRSYQIEEILGSIRPILQTKARGKKITVKEQIEDDLPEIFVDREKAGRVIINFAVNAIKFSDEGSEITLWANRGQNGHMEIGVTDQGPGLSREDLKVIFERFRQVGTPQSSTKGFGLGLNIAKQLVHLNLGQINVTSSPGDGSTFSFTFPIHDTRAVLDCYLNRLEDNSEPSDRLAALIVTPNDSDSGFEQARRFLVSTCYSMDLVFANHSKTYLLVAGVTQYPDQWVDRLQTAWVQLNNTHPNEHLSTLEFTPLGNWPFHHNHDEAVSALLQNLPQPHVSLEESHIA